MITNECHYCRSQRHWKLKMWKRRSAERQAKAEAFRVVDEA